MGIMHKPKKERIIKGNGASKIAFVPKTDYTCSIGGSNMSSVIAIGDCKRVIIGSDSRSINTQTGIINDDKTKIIIKDEQLIGIAGRTDYYHNGVRTEIEDMLKKMSVWDMLAEIKTQVPAGQETYLIILKPFHTNYEGKDIKKIIRFTVIVSSEGISVTETSEDVSYQALGVLHNKNPKITNDYIKDVKHYIENDKKIEKENKRNFVGGDIVIYEILADGTINKIQ